MRTHLHYAVVEENLQLVSDLIKKGHNVNKKDYNDATPLHLAVHTRNIQVIKTLLDSGADPFAEDQNKITPRHLAVQSNNSRIVQLFITAIVDVNKKDKQGFSLLHLAAAWGNTKIFKVLIGAGADVNVTTESGEITPLHEAIKYENLEIIKILCQNGANVNFKDKYGYSILHKTIKYIDSERTLKLLIDRGVNINAESCDGYTILHSVALGDSNVDVLKLLIESGANLNSKNFNGDTPLHLAVYRQKLNTSDVLIAAGADVNLKNKQDETPLHKVGCEKSDGIKIMKKLIQAGSNVNAKKKSGETILYQAVSKLTNLNDFKWLLKAGADANVVTNWGETPLLSLSHNFSRKTNKVEWANLLLEHTNINLTNKNGKSVAGHILHTATATYVKNILCKKLVEYVAKWKILGLEVDPSLLETISKDQQYNAHFMACIEELEKAKSTKLENCWVTFFKLIVDDEANFVKYAGNKILIKNLKKSANQFPIFKASMLSSMKKGITVRGHFNESSKILSHFLPIFDSNHLIIRNVLDTLSEEDWEILCLNK